MHLSGMGLREKGLSAVLVVVAWSFCLRARFVTRAAAARQAPAIASAVTWW